MIALTTGMITVSCVESIDFDPSGLTEAVAALGRDARRLAESTGDADRVWGGFPEAFWMPGAAEPLYRSVTPAHQAALDLEASSRTLASVVDAASYGIERLQARRGSLIDSIHSLHAIAPLRIDEFALAQPTAGSGPLGGVQWSDVPALRAADGDLRAEAASIAAGWLDAQTELAAQITRIRGGECSELALPPLGNPSVRLASAIAPTFPGGGVGTLGPDIGGFFNGLWTSLSGAGVAAGAGTAATFTAAIGELALILSLGGDTDQTRRGVSAAAQRVSAQRVALDGAARRAYDFTHTPEGSLRQTADSGILYAETGKPGPESMDDVNEILDRETRPGKSQPHREVETPEELEDVYEKVTRGGLVQPPPGGSTITSKVRLQDGTEVSWRGTSKSGGSNIDIKPAKGSNSDAIKVHMPKGYGK